MTSAAKGVVAALGMRIIRPNIGHRCMFQRQKVILHLLDRAAGRLDKLRLMKLAFLVRHEGYVVAPAAVYGFVPYLFGPYSFSLYHDLRKLTDEGVVVMDEKSVALQSRRDLPPLDATGTAGVDAVWGLYGSWGTDRLVRHVYEKFPWFTSNAKDETKRKTHRPEAQSAVYTAGYEGVSFDEFLDGLLRCGIQRVIDVRANPVARRYGFHRSTLQRNLGNLQIDYVHLPDLGIPGEERTDLSSPLDYKRLFDRYESDVLPQRKAMVARAAALQQELPSALLCMEADPEQCHRSRLGRRIAAETGLAMRDLGAMLKGKQDVAAA